MQSKLRQYVPSVALAVVVLVVAMAASATAAALITGANIKDGSVAGVDIKNGSLTGKDVGDGSVGTVDLSPAARKALVGSSCTVPPEATVGKVTMLVESDGTIVWRCVTPTVPDADGDGFESPVDCDDNDPARHPDAVEVANGLDDDCDGSLGTFSAYSGPPGTDGVGICHGGSAEETTEGPGFLGPIVGEQLPEVEVPENGLDDDCDAMTDEG